MVLSLASCTCSWVIVYLQRIAWALIFFAHKASGYGALLIVMLVWQRGRGWHQIKGGRGVRWGYQWGQRPIGRRRRRGNRRPELLQKIWWLHLNTPWQITRLRGSGREEREVAVLAVVDNEVGKGSRPLANLKAPERAYSLAYGSKHGLRVKTARTTYCNAFGERVFREWVAWARCMRGKVIIAPVICFGGFCRLLS